METVSVSETLTTAVELEALPVGSVVRADEEGGSTVAERNRHHLWDIAGVPISGSLSFTSEELAVNAPFVVLYRPDCEPVEPEWRPGRWWRAVAPDGSVWGAESSDEFEVRMRARSGDRIERQYVTVQISEWRDEPDR